MHRNSNPFIVAIMKVQIYSKASSARLEYIVELLLGQLLGLEYDIILDDDQLNFSNPILNYSDLELANSVQIIPHTLLFEEDIHEQDIEIEDGFYFFRTHGPSMAFDILASSFYMLSRYEEYLPSDLDQHGRFQAEQSLAYQHNFLDKAVVNHWAEKLKMFLQSPYPGLKFKTSTYRYLSTIDIDNAFAFKAKGYLRLWGGLYKAIKRKDADDIKSRLAYVFLDQKDPFDVYDEIEDLHLEYRTKALFFLLIGKNGAYDKNISLNQKAYQSLIKRLENNAEIGLHPSYQSNSSIDILQSETNHIESVIGNSIQNSRQHFLKLNLPYTYVNLIKAGITKDYSMGFASQAGFRAGICEPFAWFNLETNEKTKLEIVPFQVMDGTFNDYLKLSPEESLGRIQLLNAEVRRHNGLFVSLWHNESLSELRHWKGWKGVYEAILKIAQA